MGKQVLIPMTAELSLQGQQLRVADSFTQEMQTIFPGDPISEVFTPPQSVQASRVKIPLVLRVQYPLLPVFLALGGVLALLGDCWPLAFWASAASALPSTSTAWPAPSP